jgi:hypothetical protein
MMGNAKSTSSEATIRSPPQTRFYVCLQGKAGGVTYWSHWKSIMQSELDGQAINHWSNSLPGTCFLLVPDTRFA